MRYNNSLCILLIIIMILVNFIGCTNNEKSKIEQLEILQVEQNKTIEESKDKIINSQKFMHISLDDFIEAFKDISINKDKYNSIFENETFKLLRKMHEKYGAVFSCYTYYENDTSDFNLSMCTDKYKDEFFNNKEWLKFGFHSYNGSENYENTSGEKAKSDYGLFIKELLRITGSEESIDRVIRLQNFAGNDESIIQIRNADYGIKGLLGADDKRRTYNLDNNENSYLYLYDYYEDSGLYYFRTDLRLENTEDIEKVLDEFEQNKKFKEKNEILIVFTHEWQLTNSDIKEKLEKCCKFANNSGYCFDYPMNRINE